jgi:alpha-1,2-mannosyltransferase
VLLSFGFWLSGNYFLAVFSACFAVIMGWPFVAVVFIPLGLDLLLKAGFFKVLIITAAAIPPPSPAPWLPSRDRLAQMRCLDCSCHAAFLVNTACLQVLLWGVTGLAVFLSTSVAVDYHYYGSPLIAVWNLVHYNVFAPKGSELYGVEEWPFYFINLFLNFNVVFVLSLVALPVRTRHFLATD